MQLPRVKPWDKEIILAHLEAVVPLMHEAAEVGTLRARGYFDGLSLTEAEQRDPYLFAHLVRFHVGQHLDEHGQATEIDKHWLANSGVAFRYGWTDVRFLKSAAGRLPAPGRSLTKRRFYNQYISTPIWDLDPDADRSIALVNIVITWDVDYRGNLSQLVAYSPSEGGSTVDSVHWHWREPLAHPATTYAPPPPDVVEPGEDIDISRDTDEADEMGDEGTAEAK